MIVRYARERGYKGGGKDPHLTLGKEYIVIDVTYRFGHELEVDLQCDDDGTPALFPLKCFDIVDPSLPPGYVFYIYESWFAGVQPHEFEGDFWDRYHDGHEEKEKLFAQVMDRLKKFHGWS